MKYLPVLYVFFGLFYNRILKNQFVPFQLLNMANHITILNTTKEQCYEPYPIDGLNFKILKLDLDGYEPHRFDTIRVIIEHMIQQKEKIVSLQHEFDAIKTLLVNNKK